jgi:hypothetical protein
MYKYSVPYRSLYRTGPFEAAANCFAIDSTVQYEYGAIIIIIIIIIIIMR